MTIFPFTHKMIGPILAFENFQSQGNGQRGCGGTVLDQGGGSILPHSKYNDNATTLRLPCFNRKPLLLILLLLLLAAPLVSHFKAWKVCTHTSAGVVVKETNSLWILEGGKWIDGIWPQFTVSMFYGQKAVHQEQSNDRNNKIRVLIFLLSQL